MDYLDRLKNEYVDLCDKIDKLEMTIDDQDTAMLEGAETFPFVQVHLMRVQCDVMIGYRDILRARMSAAGVEIDNIDELIEQKRLKDDKDQLILCDRGSVERVEWLFSPLGDGKDRLVVTFKNDK
jgi:hypothetical protein